MGKPLTKKRIIHIYLESHPQATEKETYAGVNTKGKPEITLPYIRKMASLWRKAQRDKQLNMKNSSKSTKRKIKLRTPIISKSLAKMDINDELHKILFIMQLFQNHNLPVPRLNEVLAYLKEQQTITKSEEEFKSTLKQLSNTQLLNVIYQSQKLPEER